MRELHQRYPDILDMLYPDLVMLLQENYLILKERKEAEDVAQKEQDAKTASYMKSWNNNIPNFNTSNLSMPSMPSMPSLSSLR